MDFDSVKIETLGMAQLQIRPIMAHICTYRQPNTSFELHQTSFR